MGVPAVPARKAYLPSYLPTYLRTHLPTFLPFYLPSFLPTHPPTQNLPRPGCWQGLYQDGNVTAQDLYQERP